jgi:predicted DNA-binding transcriptional regulator YafY
VIRRAGRRQGGLNAPSRHGKRRYTVAAIAAEFGVTRPTIYRHLGKQSAAADRTGGGQAPS